MGEKYDLERYPPVVKLNRTVCQKEISLAQKAMRKLEARMERDSLFLDALPTYAEYGFVIMMGLFLIRHIE